MAELGTSGVSTHLYLMYMPAGGEKLVMEMQTLLKGHRGGDRGYTKVIEMGGAPVIIGGGGQA